MPTVPLNRKGSLKLTGGRGAPVELRPSMIVSMLEGDYTCLELVGGGKVFVKESPAQIAALIAGKARKLLAGGASYSRLAESLSTGWPPLAEITSGDDGRAERIEELTTAVYGKSRSSLQRLFGIYSEMLSPFAFFNSLAFRGAGAQAPSSLEREIATRCYDAQRKG